MWGARKEWYVNLRGEQKGPLTESEFRKLARSGAIRKNDLVWHSDLPNWVHYQSVNNPSYTSAIFFLRQILHTPIAFLTTAYEICFRPAAFGKKRIDIGSGGLTRALFFFLTSCTIAFAIVNFKAFHASGMTESRVISLVTIQILLTAPLVYLLNVITRQCVTLKGVTEAVLYVTGTIIIIGLAIYAAVLAAYVQPTKEIEIIPTEVAKCVAERSLLYWLMNGELQFYTTSATNPGWLDAFGEYTSDLIALPFFFMFGRVMYGRYGASTILNFIFFAVSLIAVNKGYGFTKSRISVALIQSANCTETAFRRAANNYNPDVLGMQVAHETNQDLVKAGSPDFSQVTWKSGTFDLPLLALPGAKDINGTADDLIQQTGRLYCGPHFYYARTLGAPLLVRVHDVNRRPIREIGLEPHMCR
jgi:hypothetical protein